MKIKDIFPGSSLGRNVKELYIGGISRDSRLAKHGDLFFVIEGENVDVFSFLHTVEHKVTAFVVDIKRKEVAKRILKKKPLIFVSEIEKEFKRCIDVFYPLDSGRLNIIGVTGTNGKTTTTSLISYLLSKFSVKNALLGTMHYMIGGKKLKANYTTPDYLSLRKLLYTIQNRGIDYVVMEISSHGIQQKRIEGLRFLQCIFTNLTHDHLDYHKSMNNYFLVKKSLFTDYPYSMCLINIDDKYGRRIFDALGRKKYSYGFDEKANYRVISYTLSQKGLRFTLRIKGKKESVLVESNLIGRHNVYNILASLASLDKLGFSVRDTVRYIPYFFGLDGRLERVGKDIFVDYAHTPTALSSVLDTLKECGYDNLILVFGCGGNRDIKKRSKMGRIASFKSTFTFITSDNPRFEDPRKICKQIEKGFSKNNYCIVIDRRKAIKLALRLKEKYSNCAVLIAGKGHEDYQIIKNRKIPFKDRKVIKELLKDKR